MRYWCQGGKEAAVSRTSVKMGEMGGINSIKVWFSALAEKEIERIKKTHIQEIRFNNAAFHCRSAFPITPRVNANFSRFVTYFSTISRLLCFVKIESLNLIFKFISLKWNLTPRRGNREFKKRSRDWGTIEYIRRQKPPR